MPSLRTLDVVHRLNAPTRAAATRRRRLRKAAAIGCLVIGAAVAAPSQGSAPAGSPTRKASSASSPDAAQAAALRGRHVMRVVPATPAPAQASRVDVWNTAGTRLVTCAPVYPEASRVPSDTVMSTTRPDAVSVALTDAEVARVAKHVSGSADSPGGLLVTACV